jgi:hypothetical protein
MSFRMIAAALSAALWAALGLPALSSQARAER